MSVLNDYRKTRLVITNETLLLVGDPSGERFSSTRAAEAVNDACLDFALKTESIKEEINVQILEDIFVYDINDRIEQDGTLREYAFPIRVGYDGTTEPAMIPTTRATLDYYGDRNEPWNVYAFREWYINTLSPGKISIVMPSRDGEDLPSEENNMQVTYVAMPNYMTANGSYPDAQIMTHLHEAIKYGAAARLLEESEEQTEFAKSVEFDQIFESLCRRAVMEQYRGETPYSDARPG